MVRQFLHQVAQMSSNSGRFSSRATCSPWLSVGYQPAAMSSSTLSVTAAGSTQRWANRP
jgi:hypothetical protein